MQSIILKNGKIFDGEKFVVGDIFVENGKISSFGKLEKENIPNAISIDVSGCIVTSGLIDIHTHLSEMGNNEFGFPADLATIPFGVLYAVDAWAEKFNLKVLESLSVETKAFLPLKFKEKDLDYKKMDEALGLFGEMAIGLKVVFDESQISGITLEHLKAACGFARERNLIVMVHSSFSPTPMMDIVDVLRKGDILTHCYHGGYHTIEENDYIAYKKAKDKGVIVDAGMAGGVHTDFAVLRSALSKGYIPDTISSDITKLSAYIRGGVYGLPMCMSIMRALGMDEIEILRATTVNAARAVGQSKWFSLQVGGSATLSVLKYTDATINITDKAGNRVISQKGYACKMSIKNGQILYGN